MCGHHNSKAVTCACTDTVVCKANHTCDTTRGCVHKDDFTPPPTRAGIKTEILGIVDAYIAENTEPDSMHMVKEDDWELNKWVNSWYRKRYNIWKNAIDKLNWIKPTHYCHECPLHTYTEPSQLVSIVRLLPSMHGGFRWKWVDLEYKNQTFPDFLKIMTHTDTKQNYGENLLIPVGGDCIRCPNGYYTSETGQTGCTSCPAGKFGEYNAYENKCVDCPRGQYQQNVGQTGCKSCPPGTKGGSTGSSSFAKCEDCPIGKFSASTTECTSCAPGKTTTSEGSAICSNCSVGFYSLNGSGCLVCPDGQFQDVEGQSSCKSCLAGKNTHEITEMRLTFNDTNPLIQIKSQCIVCPIGKFSATGYTGCVPCFLGNYQNSKGKTSCKLCPTGKFAEELGQPQCNNCSSTTYQDEKGQFECKRCPLGKYGAKQGQSLCKTCPNGLTTTKLGLTVCSKCEPGYKGLGGLCHACNNAEYQDEYGQTECKLCAGGHFAPTTDGTGHTECQSCPSGYYGWNKYTHPVEYKLINTNYWMRNCDACPIKNYLGHGGCSVTTETTMSACYSADGEWTFYKKCEEIPGNEVWDTTIRTKYECRDAWLHFLTNDEKEELLEDGTFPPQYNKYKPMCSYDPGTPPRIFWNPKSIMADKNIRKMPNPDSEYNKLNGDMAVCKVRVNPIRVQHHQIDYTGTQCHQCPSGQFSTKEGLTVYRDINNNIISNRCTDCKHADKCTRCDWGRYSRPDRIFGKKTYEEYMEAQHGKDQTEWPPKEQYYCSTCPAGWDSTARTFTWQYGTEHEHDASDGCVQCTPGTYSRFVETNEYEHDLRKYGRYKGHSGYIVSDDQSNVATSVNDYDTKSRKEDYFLNKNIFLQHKGCSRCDGEGEYQDEFGQSSCKTCSAAGLEDTPLDEVIAHLKEYTECVKSGDSTVGALLYSTSDGYDCYRSDNVFTVWNERLLINAHGMKWIKCRNATSALAPYWYASTWEGDIGSTNSYSNLNVWDEYYDKAIHSPGYIKDVYAHKFALRKAHPVQTLIAAARKTLPVAARQKSTIKRTSLLAAARKKSTMKLTSASPTQVDMCSLSYIYSDGRVGNMTKEELLDAMKEISSVLLRRGISTDILPFDIPMFSVKNLYNAQATCPNTAGGALCNFIDLEMFTCSDRQDQHTPSTGLTADKLAALFYCGDPMANICLNSTLNLTTWECI